MNKTFAAATFALAATIGGMTPAHADYTVYTNRATFEAAITNEHTETFNQLGTNLQMFSQSTLSQANGLIQPITVSGTNNFLLAAGASSLAGYYPGTGTYLVGPTSSTATDGITVALPAGAGNAAGADVANFASNSIVSFTAHTTLGETITGDVQVNAGTPNSSLGFLGVVMGTPNDALTSITFSAPVGSNQNVVIDNFSFEITPLTVPEPASMVLMAVGSLALAAGPLRRRFRPASA